MPTPAQQLALFGDDDGPLAPAAPAAAYPVQPAALANPLHPPPGGNGVQAPLSPPARLAPPPATVAPAGGNPLNQLHRHPQATHRVALEGVELAYLLRRSARRSIGFTIAPHGLTVTAPRWATLGVVETALRSKAGWVLRKLAQVGQQQVVQPQAVDWADGVALAWLGGTLVVKLGVAAQWANGANAVPISATTPKRSRAERAVLDANQILWVDLPHAVAPSRLRDAVQAWMQHQALAHFRARLDHFAPLLGVRWTALKLSSARTRWGSAKADGSIRLQWRLMQMPPETVDYVVVHELAHLLHMDHSPRFWQAVGRIVPDYAERRARLRGERLPPW